MGLLQLREIYKPLCEPVRIPHQLSAHLSAAFRFFFSFDYLLRLDVSFRPARHSFYIAYASTAANYLYTFLFTLNPIIYLSTMARIAAFAALLAISASALPLHKRIAQTTIDAVTPWEAACRAAGG